MTTCARCNAELPAGAQFCGSCGASVAAGASAPPPPMPPPMPPPIPQMPQMMRGMSMGAGAGQQTTFAGEPAEAFNQAIRAITQSGGEVNWQQPPTAAKFLIGYRDFMSTGGFVMKYDGDLFVQRVGANQTTVRFNLKLNWGSYVPLAATTIVVLLILLVTNPYVAAMGLLFVGAILAYSAWSVSSQLPEKVAKKIIQNLQGGGATAPHSAAPQPQMHTPAPPPPQPAPAAAPTPPPAADTTSSIVDQIKQLAGLRDAGAITPDEFEAKKAELLKRI